MVCELYISILLVYELKQLSYTHAVVSYHTIAITNTLLIPPKKYHGWCHRISYSYCKS